jgi:hypothetical protein
MPIKLSLTMLTTIFLTNTAMAKFEVHEWGTFTSLVGSDGRTQHGMYHEDEKLPDFVFRFGQDQGSALVTAEAGLLNTPLSPVPAATPFPCPRVSKACFEVDVLDNNVITQKMETPVIYFYTDVRRSVEVNVKFPLGVVTETYPLPFSTSPKNQPGLKLLNGETTFRVDVTKEKFAKLRGVDDGNIYGYARNVPDSNIVHSGHHSGHQTEKFIFYRGLGQFHPELKIESRSGNIEFHSPKGFEVPASFLVHVNSDGKFNLKFLGPIAENSILNVSSREIAKLADHQKDTDEGAGYRIMLPKMVKAGLTPDEARAMLDTWKHGYMRVPGLRLLYILPRTEVDRILPLTITPQPEKLERVFIGRLEILTDREEMRILSKILEEKDSFSVPSLGRFAESILRRILEVAKNKPVLASGDDLRLIEQLIQKASLQQNF